MNDTTSRGIDYGLGLSNVDTATGIRYGVISHHEVGEGWYEVAEAEYGAPTCGNDATSSSDITDAAVTDAEWFTGQDYTCVACERCFWSDEAFGDEALGYHYSGDGYELSAGTDGDIFVIKSPYYTRSQFCSPCAPGAGYLMNPCATGEKTYCLDHDWFESKVAPYPVYRVEDDAAVQAAS